MAKKFKIPRSIIITGASSGIGEALSVAYADDGVFLALSGRNEQRLRDVAELCRSRGAEVRADIVDVADSSAMSKWIKYIDHRHPLDVVIANAGISAGSGGGGESEDQVREIFAINLAGVLNTVLPAITLMRTRKRGQIAIMSSMAGFRGMPSAPAYSASKAAVLAYGEALRGYLAAECIDVSVICPGFVASRITAKNKFPMPFFIKADKAAKIIIAGLQRRKPVIAFPLVMYLLMRLISVTPAQIADALLRRIPRKG